MKIISAGIFRSGSTWLHNVTMALHPNDHVKKQHEPEAGFDMATTSYRDLRRIAASLTRKWAHVRKGYTFEAVKGDLRTCVQYHNYWLQYPTLKFNMKYEEMMADKEAMVAKIAKAFGFQNWDGILEKVESLPIPTTYGEVNKYGIHWNHITSQDYMDTSPLTQAQLDEIQREHYHWQVQHGYH